MVGQGASVGKRLAANPTERVRMRIRATILSGFLTCVMSGCGPSSASPTDVSTRRVGLPAALQEIDRVSLLAWRETLGPKYPLSVFRPDSIAMILEFFGTNSAEWNDQTKLAGVPMLAGFYRAGQLESLRGFIELSHGAGGLLVIEERGHVYSRAASPEEIARFLSFFGVGVVLHPD